MTDAAAQVTAAQAGSPLLDALRQIVGNDHVLTGGEDRRYFSSDVYREAEPAEVIVQPGTKDELARAVGAATSAGLAVIARGGGLSYTDGYLPSRSESMIVDMRRMDRILEINAEDMYVTVETGCTWSALFEALKDRGLRTPYFGPLSGLRSTVGGAISQNSMFFGSGVHGNSVDCVLGLEVVLADGQVLTTGSAATPYAPSPFMRSYGPDLTGNFLADTGALGLKAAATLRLIPFPAVTLYASFAFDNFPPLCAAMSEISRQGLAAECFAFDPTHQTRALKRRGGFLDDFKALAGVAKSAGSVAGGVKEAARVAVAGRRMFDDVTYSLHLVVDGRDEATAESMMAAAREIALGAGREIEASLPKIMRGTPFVPPNSMLGPDGERWVPIHALVPHSRAVAAVQAVHDFFAENAEVVDKHGIDWGYLLCTSGAQVFLLEPVFYWQDARGLYHNRTLDDEHLAKIKTFPEDLAARRAVDDLREGLARMFMEMGAAHFQIGKAYLYREGRNPETYRLLEAIKDAVDPDRLVNPGSLGLA
jgi:FAD/FMN-containing dehydrogenase